MDIRRHGVTGRWADSVAFGNLVFLVEVPATLDAGIEAQTREVLGSIEKQLRQAGSDKSRLLMATIYLSDLTDLDGMNAVWESWVPAGCAPVRACVNALLVSPQFRVEIQLIAARLPE